MFPDLDWHRFLVDFSRKFFASWNFFIFSGSFWLVFFSSITQIRAHSFTTFCLSFHQQHLKFSNSSSLPLLVSSNFLQESSQKLAWCYTFGKVIRVYANGVDQEKLGESVSIFWQGLFATSFVATAHSQNSENENFNSDTNLNSFILQDLPNLNVVPVNSEN